MAERTSGKASGGQLEERIDLTAEAATKTQQATTLAQAGQLPEALALLAALEKKCRLGNDNPSLVKACETSLTLAKEYGDHASILQVLQTLSTRRSQKTAAIRALVQTALPWCVEEPYKPLDVEPALKPQRDELVGVLLEITEGKIFLERERAQLTRAMATIKEQEGDVAAAADQLQDVHVETFGSLSKRDKVEFILEQMRLTLAKKDFIRAHIVAGKVSKKTLQEETMEEYKVRFYELMTIYHRHKQDALALAQDYHAIYSTASIQTDAAKWQPALKATIVFLALSPFGNEQQDMMNHIVADDANNLEEIPVFAKTLQLFLRKEIIHYPMEGAAELEGIEEFATDGLAAHWHETFHRRIIQHNIRIVAGYYRQIRLDRLAQLLQLDVARTELEISSLVSDGVLYAKIDRPASIVRFLAPTSPEAVLTSWAADIDKLLHLVETTSHLINKENMTAA